MAYRHETNVPCRHCTEGMQVMVIQEIPPQGKEEKPRKHWALQACTHCDYRNTDQGIVKPKRSNPWKHYTEDERFAGKLYSKVLTAINKKRCQSCELRCGPERKKCSECHHKLASAALSKIKAFKCLNCGETWFGTNAILCENCKGREIELKSENCLKSYKDIILDKFRIGDSL